MIVSEHDRRSAARRWGGFALGLALIALFVWGVAPLAARIPAVAEVQEAIERNDIDATGLFYTEVEIVGDVDVTVRSLMNR